MNATFDVLEYRVDDNNKAEIQKQTKGKQYRQTPEDSDPQTQLPNNKKQNIVLPNKGSKGFCMKDLNTNKPEF